MHKMNEKVTAATTHKIIYIMKAKIRHSKANDEEYTNSRTTQIKLGEVKTKTDNNITKTRQGKTRQRRQDKTRQDKTRQDKQDKTRQQKRERFLPVISLNVHQSLFRCLAVLFVPCLVPVPLFCVLCFVSFPLSCGVVCGAEISWFWFWLCCVILVLVVLCCAVL
jgi:hypothetical protein